MRKLTRKKQRQQTLFHSQREIKVLTLKNSPFPLAQSIKLHISSLVLSPCLIPRHRCEKSARESPNSQFDENPRENPGHVRGSARIYVVMMEQFVLKIEKLSHIIGARGSYHLRSPSPIMAPGFPGLVIFDIVVKLTNRMWFSVVCTLIDNEYASPQWSKCCGLTRRSRVSLQQILTTVVTRTRCR